MQTKAADELPPKSQSFEDLQELCAKARDDLNADSLISVMTRCSADKVILKKCSSSQVLPSKSRRLWWKLFLWSHRNLHKFWPGKPKSLPLTTPFNQQGGYSSDTVEPHRVLKVSKMESPSFPNGVTSLWPQNQWVAFPSPSPSFARVDEWVRDLEVETTQPGDDMNGEERITFPPSPSTGKSPARNTPDLTHRFDLNLSEEILHANNVIQTLNSSVTPLTLFKARTGLSTCKQLYIQITPGSLPKGLHTLNLSRNNINNFLGLRELTRLRVVDLSYNHITKIVHGFSICTMIKEPYLAGNKISDVEGLYRLLKLAVLDLCFNKISTTKALGQLVANYNSLKALNLLGNLLRKAVCSLLPNLRYLSKQLIKPQRAREVLTDSVAKAALGSSSWSSRRKATKRASQGGSTLFVVHRNIVAIGKKYKDKVKNLSRHH
ncbi:Leucine-rich repeat, typical subtype [Gossypium australe]|uniref:Leucine-rich repeat, typical subtype n=1 Tax=Gossypium australe TaxID=47621 RepID=A0A5B6VG68_9ROSI|nr:Leucine-rich repeat, typical subtype [Gossypium australe]